MKIHSPPASANRRRLRQPQPSPIDDSTEVVRGIVSRLHLLDLPALRSVRDTLVMLEKDIPIPGPKPRPLIPVTRMTLDHEIDDDRREREIAEIAALLRLCHTCSVAELRTEVEARVFGWKPATTAPDLRIAPTAE